VQKRRNIGGIWRAADINLILPHIIVRAFPQEKAALFPVPGIEHIIWLSLRNK
jgi:hypothetical protein